MSKAVSIVSIGILLGFLFAASGQPQPVTSRSESGIVLQEVGKNSHQGSVIGVQPAMLSLDYRSPRSFTARLDLYLAAAQGKGWITGKTVVVFPEMIGFYLVMMGERKEVYQARSQREAAMILFTDHAIAPPSASSRLTPSEIERSLREQLLKKKATQMAQVYQSVFSGLARRYRVTIVAGSVFLPSPSIRGGKIVCDVSGPLYNISAVFKPDGSLYPALVRKAFPTHEESEELSIMPGSVEALPVFQTPIGRMGVAICADTWYPQVYRTFQEKKVSFVAAPAYFGHKKYMGAIWKGYSTGKGVTAPSDVDKKDIGRLKESEAWRKYAMPGRLGPPLRSATIPFGMTVFLRGHLWEDSAEDGSPFVLSRGTLLPVSSTPSLICFWLPAPRPHSLSRSARIPWQKKPSYAVRRTEP